MKAFIVMVGAVVVLSVAYYFLIFLPKLEAGKQLLASQQQCANRSAETYKSLGYRVSVRSPFSFSFSSANYTNHWNRAQGKCFMYIQLTTDNDNLTSNVENKLLDAFEAKTYAEIILVNIPSFGGHAGVPPTTCRLYKNGNQSNIQDCHSESEFNKIVDSYMGN